MGQPEHYAFGDFRLERSQQRVLDRDGTEVNLTPRVFCALLLFVEHPGDLIDKDALMQALWPGLVVEENNISQVISNLRRARWVTTSRASATSRPYLGGVSDLSRRSLHRMTWPRLPRRPSCQPQSRRHGAHGFGSRALASSARRRWALGGLPLVVARAMRPVAGKPWRCCHSSRW